jgi:hypothetical protein
MTTKIKSVNTDFGSETDSIVLPKGQTNERVSTSQGAFRYNTETGAMELYDGNNWRSLFFPPEIASISPTSVNQRDSAITTTFTVLGSGFSAGTTAVLISHTGTEIIFNSVTRVSNSELTCVLNNGLVTLSPDEPYDIKVTTTAGTATLTDQVNVNSGPSFLTASGNLVSQRAGSISVFVEATDPESLGAVTYSIVEGALPTGITLNASTGEISGTITPDASDTVYNFTVQALDATSNASLRFFSITQLGPFSVSFTSSGTFNVPTGTTSVDVLVIAGGGGSGNQAPYPFHLSNAGGGAGGLVYRPGFTVTPGGTVSVTVGDGGSGTNSPGQDSIFGTLTAKGGGGGGFGHGYVGVGANRDSGAAPGGSGGGGGSGPYSPFGPHGPLSAHGGQATQPIQPGDSGTYGFGNAGGQGFAPPGPGTSNGNAAGGGGAGGAGQPGQGGAQGGAGRSYSIADGSTPVTYAGGGGGHPGGNGGPGGGGNSGGPIGQAGVANRGSGAGGGPGQVGGGGAGVSGGKGVVIVRVS